MAIACSADAGRHIMSDSTTTADRPRRQSDDGCVQTSGQRPDTTITFRDSIRWPDWRLAFARGREYRCVVSPTLPAFRLVVFGDTASGQDSLVIIPDTAHATPIQTIALGPEFDTPNPWDTDALRMFDIDIDGFADLIVGKSWGATGNTNYGIWMFDPAARRFVVDTSLDEAAFVNVIRGRPCIWTSWNTSVHDDSGGMFCRRGGRWILDSTVSHTWDRKTDHVIETIEIRRGDSMVVVKSRPVPDTT